MGMSFSYGPPKDKQEMIALLRAAVERGVTFFDTAEVYGPFIERRTGGRSARAVPRAGGDRHQFGFDLEPARSARPGAPGLNSRPGAHQAGRRGLAQAAQDRCHRPALSAPRRSGRADRRRGRRGEGSDPAGQGEALRPFGSGRADDPPRARRPAGHGAAERILAVVADARRRK